MKHIKLLTLLSSASLLGTTLSITSCSKPQATQYTITFSASEGVTLSGETTIKVQANTKWADVTKPSATVTEGYIDIGWYDVTEMKSMTSETIITKDTNVKYIAFSEEKTIVNVVVKTAKQTYEAVPFIQGATFADFKEYYPAMKETPVKEHCTFDGWYYSETKLDDSFVFPVGIQNLTIEAKFNPIQYSVNLDQVDGSIRANFPKTIDEGVAYSVHFTIPEYKKPIDQDKWDILVNQKSIKSEQGVTINQELVYIPESLVNGNITIVITLTDRTQYEVKNESTGITFSSLPGITYEGNILNTTYMINDKSQKLDETNSDILIGTKSIKNESTVIWKNGTLTIPAKLITDTVTIKFVTVIQDGYIETEWSTIVEACKTFEDSDRGATAISTFLSKFQVVGKTLSSLDDLVGTTKTITINGQSHLVRIIGTQHDTIVNANKTAALTFELETLLSGDKGTMWYLKWDSNNNYNYLDSVLRANLTGNGAGSKEWSKTAIKMIENENADLFAGIKLVTKQVAVRKEQSYELGSYEDKLFPLTYTEISKSISSHVLIEGTTYAYWKTHEEDRDRIKKDAFGSSYMYWLASPDITDDHRSMNVYEPGTIDYNTVTIRIAISFAFCI